MAVYDKELEKQCKDAVLAERSFSNKEDALANALEQAAEQIVSVWKCFGEYFVLPFEKWIDAERLDCEIVIQAWEIKEKLRQDKWNVES